MHTTKRLIGIFAAAGSDKSEFKRKKRRKKRAKADVIIFNVTNTRTEKEKAEFISFAALQLEKRKQFFDEF